MRLLFLTERYPPHYTGGYEIACRAVAETLRARGHEIAVLTSNYRTPSTAADDPGVLRLLHRPQDSANVFEPAFWERADTRTLRRVLAEFRPDVVYVWSLMQMFASLHRELRVSGRPILYNIQDLWLPRQLEAAEARRAAWRQASPDAVRGAAKTAARVAFDLWSPTWWRPVSPEDLPLEHVVFCSDFQRRQHVAAGLPLGDFRIIYNGIDLDLFRTGIRSTSDAFRVLFVGRLVAEKGAHVALAGVARLRESGVDARLTIAGVPAYPLDYVAGLESLAARPPLQGSVRFLSNVPNAELASLHLEHDVLAFPSRHLEGLPMTLIEAMATGLAVVTTTAGGSAEMVRDGENALVVAPEDPAALAAALERLRLDAGLRKAVGVRARAWVEAHCSLATIGAATLAYLDEILERRRAVP
jgi:glycogen synthase